LAAAVLLGTGLLSAISQAPAQAARYKTEGTWRARIGRFHYPATAC